MDDRIVLVAHREPRDHSPVKLVLTQSEYEMILCSLIEFRKRNNREEELAKRNGD